MRLRRRAPVERPVDLDRFDPDDWADGADLRHPLVGDFGYEFVRRLRAHARWSAARRRAGLPLHMPSGPVV